jgi:hypothetical protein
MAAEPLTDQEVSCIACQLCEYKTTNVYNLKLHKIYSHGKAHFKCPKCDHFELESGAIVNHTRIAHYGD